MIATRSMWPGGVALGVALGGHGCPAEAAADGTTWRERTVLGVHRRIERHEWIGRQILIETDAPSRFYAVDPVSGTVRRAPQWHLRQGALPRVLRRTPLPDMVWWAAPTGSRGAWVRKGPGPASPPLVVLRDISRGTQVAIAPAVNSLNDACWDLDGRVLWLVGSRGGRSALVRIGALARAAPVVDLPVADDGLAGCDRAGRVYTYLGSATPNTISLNRWSLQEGVALPKGHWKLTPPAPLVPLGVKVAPDGGQAATLAVSFRTGGCALLHLDLASGLLTELRRWWPAGAKGPVGGGGYSWRPQGGALSFVARDRIHVMEWHGR